MKYRFLMLASLVLALNGCYYDYGYDAHGPITIETRTVNTFNAINVSLAANIFISQEPTQNLRIETHEDILPFIDSYVVDGELILDLRRNIASMSRLNIYISAEDYERIRLSGAANIRSEGCLSLDNLEMRISGAGTVNLCGETEVLDVRISGAGNFQGYGMVAEEVDATISGAGNLRVTAESILDVRISGAGSVYYRGNPQISSDISGAGSLINAN